MQLAMIGERIVPLESLENIYLDRGIYFGDGVYEVVRSYNGKLFALDEHLERFQRSLKEVLINGVDIDEIRKRIILAFEKAQIANAKVYFHITRGQEDRTHSWGDDIEPTFFLTIHELPDTSEIKRTGIKVAIEPDLRWKRCDIKSLNLLPNVLATQSAKRKGASEAVLVDSRGDITEGAGSAFFAIIDDTLITRPLGPEILPSVTRKIVVSIAASAGLKVVEKVLTPAQAEQADELFLAVTTRDIIPVIEFDGKMISNGVPGPKVTILIEEFKNYVKQMCGLE